MCASTCEYKEAVPAAAVSDGKMTGPITVALFRLFLLATGGVWGDVKTIEPVPVVQFHGENFADEVWL